jgi:hypothetical protein
LGKFKYELQNKPETKEGLDHQCQTFKSKIEELAVNYQNPAARKHLRNSAEQGWRQRKEREANKCKSRQNVL